MKIQADVLARIAVVILATFTCVWVGVYNTSVIGSRHKRQRQHYETSVNDIVVVIGDAEGCAIETNECKQAKRPEVVVRVVDVIIIIRLVGWRDSVLSAGNENSEI